MNASTVLLRIGSVLNALHRHAVQQRVFSRIVISVRKLIHHFIVANSTTVPHMTEGRVLRGQPRQCQSSKMRGAPCQRQLNFFLDKFGVKMTTFFPDVFYWNLRGTCSPCTTMAWTMSCRERRSRSVRCEAVAAARRH